MTPAEIDALRTKLTALDAKVVVVLSDFDQARASPKFAHRLDRLYRLILDVGNEIKAILEDCDNA